MSRGGSQTDGFVGEGLANDVPISSMSRGIERDILQVIDRTELPPARALDGMIQF